MVCFPIIEKPENRSELNGIIKIIQKSANPLKYIEPTSGSGTLVDGDIRSLVLWNSYFRAKANTTEEEAWFQLDFKHLRIYPISYALRGMNKDVSMYYGNQWSVYGIKENDIDKSDNWKNLGTHESAAGKYCGDSPLCLANGSIDTFDVNNEKFDGFRYIRFVSKKVTHPDSLKLLLASAVEVYGLLINPNKCIITCKLRNKASIVIYALHILLC